MSDIYPLRVMVCDRANDVPAGSGSRICIVNASGYILPNFSDIENPTLARFIADALNEAYAEGKRDARRGVLRAIGLED